jgi:eukaryotic-like serine/threonine-protein kinase
METEDLVPARLAEGLQGRYTITRVIGRGGMATVYEAMDLSHHRRVAMKVLRPEIGGSLGSERFSREIRITANLSHPHILPVHEAGEAGGLLFYIMPLVEGESLRDRLARERRLPVDDVLRITREVGQALTYAHAQGVVHRDLKPENIMLAGGVAVVADFGIARGGAFVGGENLTSTGMALGTPAYMSPEQAGSDATLDQRSDEYSLACVVYEMLAGEPPFRGSDLFAMLAKHATERIPDVRKLRPDVPPEIAQSIRTALAKEPADRFASVDEFVAALEGTRSPTIGHRRRAVRRTRALWIAAAAAALVLAVATIRFGPRLGRSTPSAVTGPVVAVLPFEHIGTPEDDYVAQGISNEISNSMSGIGGVSVISRASAMQFDLKRRTLADVKRELKADYVVTGSVQTERQGNGSTRIRLWTSFQAVSENRDLYNDSMTATLNAGALFEIQQRIAQRVATILNLTLQPQALEFLRQGQTVNADAYRDYLQGNIHAAQFLVAPEQLQAIGFFERATGLDPDFALAWSRLAQVQATYYSLYDHSPARLARLTEAVRKADSLRPDDAETGIARGYLAIFGRHDRALAMRELLAARKKRPNSTELLWAIGHVYRSRGAMDSAFAQFSEAARLDPRSQMIVFESAAAAFMQRRYPTVLALLAQARAIAPNWPPATLSLANVRLYMGQRDSAAAAYAPLIPAASALTPFMVGEWLYRPLWDMVMPEAFQDALERLTLTNPLIDSAGYYYNKGRLMVRRHRPGAARAYFDSLRVLQTRHRSGRSPDYQDVRDLLTVIDLAAANLELGDSAAARAFADTARAHHPIDVDGFRGAFASTEIARIYARLGDRPKALALLRELVSRPSPVSHGLLEVDPAFQGLRGDPGFAPLLAAAR